MNKRWKYVEPHLLVQRRVPISTNVERNVEKCIIRLSGSFARIFFVCATYVLLRLLLFLHEKNIWTVVQGNEEKISEETKIFLWLPPSRITTHKWWFVNRIHYRSATKSDDLFIGFVSCQRRVNKCIWLSTFEAATRSSARKLDFAVDTLRFYTTRKWWFVHRIHLRSSAKSDDLAIGFNSCQRLKNDGNHSYEETRFAWPIDIFR